MSAILFFLTPLSPETITTVVALVMVRYEDWVVNYSVGACFSTPTETSAAMSSLSDRFHYFICIIGPYNRSLPGSYFKCRLLIRSKTNMNDNKSAQRKALLMSSSIVAVFTALSVVVPVIWDKLARRQK